MEDRVLIRRFLSAAMLLCAAPSGAQTPGLPTVGLPTPQIPAPHDGGRGPGPLPFPGGPIAGPAGWAGAGALALLATGIPDRLSGMMDDAAAGLALGAPADCLRRLQSMALAGGLARAMLPFSDAWTLEDARGPVVRLRVVIAGLQRHQDSWCEGGRLAAETLPWGKGEAAPRAAAGHAKPRPPSHENWSESAEILTTRAGQIPRPATRACDDGSGG